MKEDKKNSRAYQSLHHVSFGYGTALRLKIFIQNNSEINAFGVGHTV